MTDDTALRAAILAAPADDAPRLVYTDWLDEHAGAVECERCAMARASGYALNDFFGDGICPACKNSGRVSTGNAERAEFIRVQVELARDWPTHSDLSHQGTKLCRGCVLRRRERELLLSHRDGIAAWSRWGLPDHGEGYYLLDVGEQQNQQGIGLRFRRGFVAEVRLTCGQFCGGPCENCDGTGTVGPHNSGWSSTGGCPDCGGRWESCEPGFSPGSGRTPALAAALFAAHPITAVRLSDRPAHRLGDHFCHMIGTGGVALPEAVWKPLYRGQVPRVWETAEQADAALSASLVRFGRAAAGLPKLEVSR